MPRPVGRWMCARLTVTFGRAWIASESQATLRLRLTWTTGGKPTNGSTPPPRTFPPGLAPVAPTVFPLECVRLNLVILTLLIWCYQSRFRRKIPDISVWSISRRVVRGVEGGTGDESCTDVQDRRRGRVRRVARVLSVEVSELLLPPLITIRLGCCC